MNKQTFKDIHNQQIVDIRSQHDFQKGHLKDSINLNTNNLKKYGLSILDRKQPVLFVIQNNIEEEIQGLDSISKELGLQHVDGYIDFKEIPQEHLQESSTISAKDFLNKDEDYVLLDVRHPDEITRFAPEKNLVNIPLEALTQKFETLDLKKEIYTLCGSGNRGTTAASFLAEKGFKTVVISGGMKAVEEQSK